MEGKILEYKEQDKKGKKQIINFIRKVYSNTDFRDIYTGLHKAILKDNRLIGVSTSLSMISEQLKKQRNANTNSF